MSENNEPRHPQTPVDSREPRQPEQAQPAAAPFGQSTAVAAGPAPKKRRVGRIVLIVVLCVVLALVLAVLIGYYQISNQISGERTVAGVIPPENTTEAVPEYTGKSLLCGLICGIDYDNETADGYTTEDKIGNTDLILYLMYDTDAGTANFLQIPRDVYVGENLSTGDSVKINALYRHSPDPDNRIAALSDVIFDQLALPVDFYITVDMDALKEIIDIVNMTGEFLVYVPRDIVDPDHPQSVLEQGMRAFTGEEAEFFLRNRNYVDGDLTRLQMQQNFYAALYREFTQLAPSDLLMWMRVVLHRVKVGGLNALQAGGLAQGALGMQAENILFVRPPVTGAWHGDEQLVALVPDETADLLNQYFRPEGHTVPVEELGIETLPVDPLVGKAEASVRTMGEVQAAEGAG